MTGMSELAKKYRRKYAGSIAVAILIGGFIGGLIGLSTWAAVGKRSPHPTVLGILVYTGIGLSVILGAAVRLHRKIRKERGGEKPE